MIDMVRGQMSFLGHILRQDNLKNLVVTGFVAGKCGRGRQRETCLTYLGKITHKLLIELIRLSKNRDVWAKLCTLHST